MEAPASKGSLLRPSTAGWRRSRGGAAAALSVRSPLLLAVAAAVGLVLLMRGGTGRVGGLPPERVTLAAVDTVGASDEVAEERLLRALVEACSRREETVIYVRSGVVAVEPDINYGHCPLLDIMLRGRERGVGTCTDVSLYIARAGARVIPMPPAAGLVRYEAACGGGVTARLLLESMYGKFVSPDTRVLHLQLVNSEHLWAADAALHARVGGFLCKTWFCGALLRAHVAAVRLAGRVVEMGHTSGDPTVDLPPGVAREGFGALHVRGKSGLKHSQQLLQCWSGKPDWPVLHAVGRFTWKEARAFVGRPNIRFYPQASPELGTNRSAHVSFQDIRNLQARMPLHMCTSEREGFGHYINEARAAAALVVSTDHPPMRELVTNASGVLVRPRTTGSYPSQALGRYHALNAFLTPDDVCAGAAAALAMPHAEAAARMRAARAAYEAERAAFRARLAELVAFLRRRRDAVAAARGLSPPLQAAAGEQAWDAWPEAWAPAGEKWAPAGEKLSTA